MGSANKTPLVVLGWSLRKDWLTLITDYRRALTEAILNDDLDRDFERAHKKAFFDADDTPLKELTALYGWEVFQRCIALRHNRFRRVKRVREKTGKIVLGGQALFLTLTFKDEVLASTSEQTRRRYVARWLKHNCKVYVANIDYGKKNEREHYHALVWTEKVDYTGWHKYGAVKGERVHAGEDDLKRTSKYVVKLARHATKETAGKTCRMIYSRCTSGE